MNMENEKIDINDVAFTIEVDQSVIDEVRSSVATHIAMNINDECQNLILENIDGHLLLCTEEMPEMYHGCYYYNNGTFPYIIKKSLQFLVLAAEKDSCLVRIVSATPEATTRFRFQGSGKPSIEDPNGDSCIWQMVFEIKPVTKTYLLRWNPAISSFTETDYHYCVEESEDGMFPLNWSIYEWEDAHMGDEFYMMRVGDEDAGIVFSGKFTSEPYTADDWAGTSKKRHYMDMLCKTVAAPWEKPSPSLERLKEAIPEIDWSKGHSGVLLPMEIAEKLKALVETSK